MEIVLNRKGGVPLHDQLLAQLELQILGGRIAPGERLPSVRALARRLGLHANTVSAAYQHLESAGHVELRRGAGVYVRAGAPRTIDDASGLDQMIRLTLREAFRKGYGAVEIRDAVERWLRASPPERIVVVDPREETLELLAHELCSALGVPASGCTLEALARERTLLSGALALALPYHAGKVARLVPGAAIVTVHVDPAPEDRAAIRGLPAGATVLVISRSPLVMSFAAALIGGLRGDEVHVETRALGQKAAWRRLLPAADLVFADVLAAEAVSPLSPRRMRVVRLLGSGTLERVRRALDTVVPRD